MITAFERGSYSTSSKTLTVADAVDAWLESKRGVVRAITFATYKFQSNYVVGPLPSAEARLATARSGTGAKLKGRGTELLGRERVQSLTTRRIRAWHTLISDEVSPRAAGKALMVLKASLALAAEDHEFRPPAMPSGLQRRRERPTKAVLSPNEVARLIAAAREDRERGVYVAFAFLAGTRSSEQLALLWEDLDLAANVVHIRRTQLRDGSLTELTKTDASVRSIPMSPILRAMLLEWRLRCPRLNGEPYRVFPAPGLLSAWPLPRKGGGGPLLYFNFLSRYWRPFLHKLGLPPVTPHSARHSFISVLQAQGVEVGLVAKLAGHKSAVVTLSHYTHAMRGGEDAVIALDKAYGSRA